MLFVAKISSLKNSWQLLSFGFLLQFFSISGQTVFISLFGGYIRADLHLSHSEFGGYYSIATFLSAIALSYTGKFADHVRLEKLTPIVTTLLALSCLMLAFTYNIWLLIFVFFLLRHLGQGLFSLISITAVMRYIQKNRGSASSISRMGYTTAEGIMPMIVVLLLWFLSWRSIWIIMAIALIIVVIPLSYFLLKNHRKRHQEYLENLNKTTSSQDTDLPNEKSTKQFNRQQVLHDPLFYLILPSLLATPMLFTGFIFHQIQLLSEKGWELSWWSGVILTFSITGAGFLMLSGLLVDRFTAKKVLFLIPITLGIGLAILAYATNTTEAIISIIFISFAASTSACLSAPLLVELYGTKHFASIKSLSTSLMIFSTSISPFIMGFFLDQGFSFNTILFTGSAYCLLSLMLLVPMWIINPD